VALKEEVDSKGKRLFQFKIKEVLFLNATLWH
jgi:hypothetical protein